MPPRRLIYHADELRELAERQQLPIDLVERDFVLVSIAALLVEDFPGQLCFKGGFVPPRSTVTCDSPATWTRPGRHRRSTSSRPQMSGARSNARVGRSVESGQGPGDRLGARPRFRPDRLHHGQRWQGPRGRRVSYREAVVLEPHEAMIGAPYYEPFAVPVLRPEEIVAEKLRALAQRSRPTDLSGLAWLLERVGAELDDALVAELVARKFVPGLVAPGASRPRASADRRLCWRLRRPSACARPRRTFIRRRIQARESASRALFQLTDWTTSREFRLPRATGITAGSRPSSRPAGDADRSWPDERPQRARSGTARSSASPSTPRALAVAAGQSRCGRSSP